MTDNEKLFDREIGDTSSVKFERIALMIELKC